MLPVIVALFVKDIFWVHGQSDNYMLQCRCACQRAWELRLDPAWELGSIPSQSLAFQAIL